MENVIRSCGIVLRRQEPRRQSISLLHRHLGRIETFSASLYAGRLITNGSLIEYALDQKGQNFVLHDILLIEQLSYAKIGDMRFFHHLLELAYYGIPIGAGALDIFELL